jgi:hypothetical protein
VIKRPLRFALLVVTLCAATTATASVFVNKKLAERDARAIGELNRKIGSERQRISELQAEWSALDHPARLQALLDRHNGVLDLKPLSGAQVMTVAEVASAMRKQIEIEAKNADAAAKKKEGKK